MVPGNHRQGTSLKYRSGFDVHERERVSPGGKRRYAGFKCGAFRAGGDRFTLGQTLHNFELVIVDNGSTDATPKFCTVYGTPAYACFVTPAITAAQLQETSACAKREHLWLRGWTQTTSPSPHRLERQLAEFARCPGLALLGAQARYFGAHGRTLVRRAAPQPVTRTRIKWHPLFGSPFVHSTLICTRESFEAAGGYHEPMQRSADLALSSRIQASYDTANLPEVLVGYRDAPRLALADSAQLGVGKWPYPAEPFTSA